MKMLWVALVSCILSALPANEIQIISKLNGVLRKEDLSKFKENFQLSSFIETGTYSGDTTDVAAKVFRDVYSVEIFEPLYLSARKRFARRPNIHLYFGDTCTLLHKMILDSPRQKLYWLDAHSSGSGTGGKPGFSPIPDELDQIVKFDGLDSVILIDDLRGMCHCDARTNLPLLQIIEQIKQVDSNLMLYSIGDIGVIFNQQTYPYVAVSELVKATTISRFFDPKCEGLELLDKLIDAEKTIALRGKNTQEDTNLHKLFGFVNKGGLGGEVVYLLWEALYELEHGDYSAAARDLTLVSNSFYSHWRITAYLIKALMLNGQYEQAIRMFTKDLQLPYQKFPAIITKILGEEQITQLTQESGYKD